MYNAAVGEIVGLDGALETHLWNESMIPSFWLIMNIRDQVWQAHSTGTGAWRLSVTMIASLELKMSGNRIKVPFRKISHKPDSICVLMLWIWGGADWLCAYVNAYMNKSIWECVYLSTSVCLSVGIYILASFPPTLCLCSHFSSYLEYPFHFPYSLGYLFIDWELLCSFFDSIPELFGRSWSSLLLPSPAFAFTRQAASRGPEWMGLYRLQSWLSDVQLSWLTFRSPGFLVCNTEIMVSCS